MRISCPHCGTRTSEEFTYLGDATKQRPHASTDLAQWNDYVHLRDNPHGSHQEYWLHTPCRSWLIVTRNVTTHEIFAVAKASPSPINGTL